jgi:hypothetical protein
MAAFMLAQHSLSQRGLSQDASRASMDMSGMNMPASSLPAGVAFPYGFPTSGRYRIFVQMKHGATIETAVFDTQAQ